MRYNYQYGDGGVVDETSAEFKALGDTIKAKKKESVGTYFESPPSMVVSLVLRVTEYLILGNCRDQFYSF